MNTIFFNFYKYQVSIYSYFTCLCIRKKNYVTFCVYHILMKSFKSPSPVQKEFTDTAIPNVIQCPINSTCGIPLIISGPPGDM